MKSVAILGGGIGGLTAAHELSKLGYAVSVYERNDCLGGMARSKFNKKNLPCSYSWRVYGKYYNNLRKVIKEIPLNNNPKKTVHDNLIDINTYYIVDYSSDLLELRSTNLVNKIKNIKRLSGNFTYKDTWIIIKTFLYFLCISDERLEAYDDISWKEYMAGLSLPAKNYIIRSMGPFYGMDIDNVSVFASIYCFYSVFNYLFSPTRLSVMNAPTNIAWFDHWESYLESKSVKIYLNHEVKDVEIINNKITRIHILDKKTNEQKITEADYIISDLSIEEVVNRIHFSDKQQVEKMQLLAQKSRQIQLSIHLYLDDRLIFPDQKSVFWLPESPWALIIESQLTLWTEHVNDDQSVKDVLSVGICDWSTKGLKIKKAFIDCTFPEIIEEVWYQIKKCPGLQKLPTECNRSLAEIKILYHNIWESFYINEKGKVDTWEPKYSNNVGCYNLTPSSKSNIENLFFSTAYTKNTQKIFTMDSAVESGFQASNEVLKREEKKSNQIKIFSSTRPLKYLFGWIRKLDGFFYRNKSKHMD